MCEVCEGKTSIEELHKKMVDTIMEKGHQVIGVPDGKPQFAYSIGRGLFDKPEFVVRGALSVELMMHMINAACRLQDDGEVVKDGHIFEPEKILGGFPVKVVKVDPKKSEMFQAINLFGEDIEALQLVWPDKQGNWPDEPAYDSRFAQPIDAI